MGTLAQIRDALQSMFNVCAEKSNEAHRVIQRKRRFTVQSFTQTFLLAFLQNPRASSEAIAAMAASCGVDVTKQAVDKRFTQRSADFFECLFTQSTQLVVQSDQQLAPLLARFTEVAVIDSSSITLPDSQENRFQGRGGKNGSGKSAVKLQTELELRSGALTCVNLEQGRDSDMACDRQTAERPAGSLRISDLGYFSVDIFRAIARQSCYLLSRIQWTTLVWTNDAREGTVIEFLNSQGSNQFDGWVEIGSKDRLKCRLIAWRVPTEVAAARRRKLYAAAKKRNRKPPSAEALASCDWMFLVTNLPEDRLTFKEAIVLYRARWQIELLFKRWKSIGLIAELQGRNDIEKMVRLWARLCVALIQHWLVVLSAWRSDRSLSFMRVAKMIPTIAEQLAFALNACDCDALIEKVLAHFENKVAKSARRDKRKKVGTLEMLRNPELLDYVLS